MGVREHSKAPRKASPRGPRLPRAKREQQLLDTAMRLFVEQGYQGTSIEELARAAGVTRPIIYHHFGSKDGIYLACLRRAREELDAKLSAIAGQSDDLAERLSLGVKAYFGFVESHRAEWCILFGGGVAVAGPAAQEAQALRFATVGRITELLAGVLPGVGHKTLEAYAHAVSGAGEQLAKWWIADPDVTQDDVVTALLSFASTGLRGLQA